MLLGGANAMLPPHLPCRQRGSPDPDQGRGVRRAAHRALLLCCLRNVRSKP